MMTEITSSKIRENFSRNLAFYRKAANKTQLELANELNYSDKSVSKWERGEGLPDLEVTAQIANILGVSVGDLIADKVKRRVLITRNKALITGLSVGVVWLIAAILFFLFQLVLPSLSSWMIFIYALPVSSIVAIVFSCIWWRKIHILISVSALIWSAGLCVALSFANPKVFLIFIIAAILELLSLLAFFIKK
ncbi:MAG: helix-turn-helix transcriptional regulator [Clostridia bacterium]|nr:helix-turn-helix transcriptional regulator [Clostridia bacterium]